MSFFWKRANNNSRAEKLSKDLQTSSNKILNRKNKFTICSSLLIKKPDISISKRYMEPCEEQSLKTLQNENRPGELIRRGNL
ncbi:11087_t:CDS:2 [Cetraspora pellucida]|uniref:11087_t:CDS:1 n=1 Tax=Cetraspora pellucida TaxID=1433469 RepID=A0ACA9L968_9GLOM|nr:11087_t:CDS:2 [Cetraspora pellucida]